MLEFFHQANIPKQRILFLHVRLRHIQQRLGQPYLALSQAILQQFEQFEPKAMLIPAYTFSFMKSGIFHRQFSKSEVGRFSEEVRQHLAKYRTPDPMYSILDVTGYLANKDFLDYTRTLGENSLFQHLHDENAIVINVDLVGFWSTLIHEVERINQVPYRHHKVFKGVVYHDEQQWHQIEYQAFVRHMDDHGISYPPYNYERRKQCLLQAGVLHRSIHNQIELTWVYAAEVRRVFHEAVANNRCFLVD